MKMNEAQTIRRYVKLQKHAESLGLKLSQDECSGGEMRIISPSKGVCFESVSLDKIEGFIVGVKEGRRS